MKTSSPRTLEFIYYIAWRKAKDRDIWRQVISTATLWQEFAKKKKKKKNDNTITDHESELIPGNKRFRRRRFNQSEHCVLSQAFLEFGAIHSRFISGFILLLLTFVTDYVWLIGWPLCKLNGAVKNAVYQTKGADCFHLILT